ncbi:MAG: chromosome segregation protein, partial [Erythrobacter cryptus]
EHALHADRPAALAAELAAGEKTAERLAAELAEAEAAMRAAEARQRAADAALAAAGEALAEARETRAGLCARAENEELRRAEMARISGERFQCPPPLLPARLGFAEEDLAPAAEESATLERLTAARERLGPVNLVAA